MRRRAVALMLVVLASMGCDPCAGTIGCVQDPELRVEGRVVHYRTGEGVRDAEVSVKARGIQASVLAAGDGQFALEAPLSGYGKTEYELFVQAPGDRGFRAPLTCWVSTTLGSGCPLGLVSSRPHFPTQASITYRGSNDVVIPDAAITFKRTGGVDIYGDAVVNDAVSLVTNEFGLVFLFGPGVYSTEVGDVIGQLTVDLPPPLDSATVDSVRVPSALVFRATFPLRHVKVGPSLRYIYEFNTGTIGVGARGVKVRLNRTGGIATRPDTAVGVTDSTGVVELDLWPLQRGTITADLTVTPPAPHAPFTISGLVLATHDDDKAPVKGRWSVANGQAMARRVRR